MPLHPDTGPGEGDSPETQDLREETAQVPCAWGEVS